MEHTIKYYPVGNADCTLIKLDNDNNRRLSDFIRPYRR